MKTTETSIILVKAEIKALLAHASTDITRAHLNGVRIQVQDGVLSLVATDGHRLVVARQAAELPDIGLTVPSTGLKSGLGMLRRKSDTLRIEPLDDGDVLLEGFDPKEGASLGRIIVKATDLAFPPWQQVVPRHTGEGQDGEGSVTQIVNLRPKYLADLVLIERALKDAGGPAEDMHVLPGFGDLDPTVFIAGIDTEWTVVIMPRRQYPKLSKREFSK